MRLGKDRESVVILAEGAAILLVIAEVFYRSLLAVILLLPLLIPICRRSRRNRETKYTRELCLQFKEMMNSILTALKAGYAAENAFREAKKDMEFLYGKRSAIYKELCFIEKGLDNNIPIEKLVYEFGERSRTPEIEEFAEVFAIAKKNGGSMTEILSRSITLIQSRIDVESEITILISAKKLEQNIMDLVPVIIIVYISLTSKGFFDVLYHNIPGIIFMTACLFVYGTAFVISERITSITV